MSPCNKEGACLGVDRLNLHNDLVLFNPARLHKYLIFNLLQSYPGNWGKREQPFATNLFLQHFLQGMHENRMC